MPDFIQNYNINSLYICLLLLVYNICKSNYHYINIRQNLEIYNSLTDDDTYKDWFINENEDLYNSIKINSEFVDNLNNNVKIWFETNEVIQKYENDLIQFELNYEIYNDQMKIYYNLIEEEIENNIQNICPLCRL